MQLQRSTKKRNALRKKTKLEDSIMGVYRCYGHILNKSKK